MIITLAEKVIHSPSITLEHSILPWSNHSQSEIVQ